MSVLLVTGGTGTLGTKLVPLLRERGHDVRVLSRRPGAGTHVGDLNTGEGLAAAADGAEIVVHAASDTRRLGRADVQQTLRLLAVAGRARHLLYVSIVGIDAIPYAYYKRKLASEREIEASAVPYTIFRATQFHELLELVLRKAERLPVAPLPLELPDQPVAAADVAQRIAELVDGDPLGRAPDFGGPEVLTVGSIVDTWRAHRGRPRRVIGLRLPGRVARGFREGRHTCPDHADGSQTWADFVKAVTSAGHPAPRSDAEARPPGDLP